MTGETAGAILTVLNALMLFGAVVPLAYGGYKAHRAAGMSVVLRRSKRARSVVLVNALMLYIAVYAVFAQPYPPDAEFVVRAIATRWAYIAIEVVLAGMLVDAAYSLRQGGRRKTG